ncbi:hypothetical protein P872_02695 [Rhodonellum psychrophilum GCM71 = DSM 17998]|uniref:Uncharacterized protein n=1 Tax=Rhodonellum psychrophilum GCM71 = DSM 17998 TaxID=1123057 RepID=U5C691_9BACT|nr:hypothetical protein P872_02695 [Rhodonellum psychrophilum GCM71 = DSM 17998]
MALFFDNYFRGASILLESQKNICFKTCEVYENKYFYERTFQKDFKLNSILKGFFF